MDDKIRSLEAKSHLSSVGPILFMDLTEDDIPGSHILKLSVNGSSVVIRCTTVSDLARGLRAYADMLETGRA